MNTLFSNKKITFAVIIISLLAALGLFVWAVVTQRFELREKAVSGEVTPSPVATPTESPTPTPSGSPSATPSPSASASVSPTPTPLVCNPSDINKDGISDLTDYSILANDFFKTNPANPRSDINLDGIVDVTDYSLFVSHFFENTGECQ